MRLHTSCSETGKMTSERAKKGSSLRYILPDANPTNPNRPTLCPRGMLRADPTDMSRLYSSRRCLLEAMKSPPFCTQPVCSPVSAGRSRLTTSLVCASSSTSTSLGRSCHSKPMEDSVGRSRVGPRWELRSLRGSPPRPARCSVTPLGLLLHLVAT